MRSFIIALFTMLPSLLFAQADTTKHGWPVTPFHSTQPITGVFGEFRNTGSADHFHNGVDIPKPDGSPVYPVYSGVVNGIGSVASSGSNAYVRVRYDVSGFSKSDAYVHITPNPLLNIGDSVFAYQTVLGTVYPGQGHVHFTNGYVGSEMNGIRPNGGFTPYIDNYPPAIMSIRFFQDESSVEFVGGKVSGRADIRVHIRETNAADPSGVTSSTSNNGTYIVGYKILSADRSTVVLDPAGGSQRFRFDSKPGNSYVSRVYAPGSDLSTHIYTVTNGNGADFINATGVVNNNFWNTEDLPVGNYSVMIFARDTRNLADTQYVNIQISRADLIPPAAPRLQSVLNDSTNRITLRWYPNTEPDLLGYRLYFSSDGVSWVLRDNETKLTPTVTSISYPVASSGMIFFRLAAIDSATPTNVSPFSDVYGIRINLSPVKTLIVDGFDRTELSGSFHDPSHSFAFTHGRSMPLDFSTCANEALIEGRVNMTEYQVVVWILGDESTTDRTFDSMEQALVRSYLRAGGKLFVSGSELGWDLDRPDGATQADRDFLYTFLKARFAGDDAADYSVYGVPATLFAATNLRYGLVPEGSPYLEDYPDYFLPEGGSTPILTYGSGATSKTAAVGFKGMFSGGSIPGAVVTMGFPFETITTRANRDSLMKKVYQYFDYLTTVSGQQSESLPQQFDVLQNYPNPFNPSTVIEYALPSSARVRVTVFDLLGQEVVQLVNDTQAGGRHHIEFDGRNFSSGVYVYRIDALPLDAGSNGFFTVSKKMILAK